MERFLKVVDSPRLDRTSFEDRLARVNQRKSEEAEQQRLAAAVKADEERKAKAVGSLLAVVCLSLVAAVYVIHQGKVGPLELSRNLPFDNQSDWNQFYDPESARRFEAFAHQTDASGAAGEAANVAADAMRPATAAAGVDVRHRFPAAESPAPASPATSDSASSEAAPSITSGAADVSAPAASDFLPAASGRARWTALPLASAPAGSAAAPGDATELTSEETPATQAMTRPLPADAAREAAARVPTAPGATATSARDATATPIADLGPSATADRVTNLPAVARESGSDNNKKSRSPAVATKLRARLALAPVRKAAPPKSVVRAPVHAVAASRVRGHAPTRQSTLQPRVAEQPQSAPPGYAQQPYVQQSLGW
jgi:hypothetical protein